MSDVRVVKVSVIKEFHDVLVLDYAIPEMQWEELRYQEPRFTDPLSMSDHFARTERRQRFVDLLAKQFAHALTEALMKQK